MKKFKFLAVVCCMAAVFAACENDTKSKIEELENRIEGLENGGKSDTGNDTDQNDGNSNSGNNSATGTANGHEWVDLGLPSGLKWATCNVGATKPEEYGNYYAWGETSPKTTYDWNTYKWATATWNTGYNGWEIATLTKYNTSSEYGTVDNKTVLELADDAARANWGGAWRMPTYAEWMELRKNCIWNWTSNYNGTGVKGEIVMSNINGNSIFLPAAGSHNSAGGYGVYWSSSLNPDNPIRAWNVSVFSFNVYEEYNDRCNSLSVRPVLGE